MCNRDRCSTSLRRFPLCDPHCSTRIPLTPPGREGYSRTGEPSVLEQVLSLGEAAHVFTGHSTKINPRKSSE